jgi:hypothetical protein
MYETLPLRAARPQALIDEVTFWDLLSEYTLVAAGGVPSALQVPRFEPLDAAHAAAVLLRAVSRSWPNADWHLLHLLGIDAARVDRAALAALVTTRIECHTLYRRIREPQLVASGFSTKTLARSLP